MQYSDNPPDVHCPSPDWSQRSGNGSGNDDDDDAMMMFGQTDIISAPASTPSHPEPLHHLQSGPDSITISPTRFSSVDSGNQNQAMGDPRLLGSEMFQSQSQEIRYVSYDLNCE
jgi:hypothetical protein